MSTQSRALGYACEHCEGRRQDGASFCSTECRYRHKGENVLRNIRFDHRFCSTCYRQLRDIEKPPDELLIQNKVSQLVRESIIGFEYPTPNYQWEQGIWSCKCGTINHKDEHGFLQLSELECVLVNLVRVLQRYEREGQLDTFSVDSFFSGFREISGLDYAYAVGRSLE